MKSPLGNYFEARRRALLEESKGVFAAHKGLRGHERELFVSRFLRDHVPAQAGIVNNGQVIDHRWASTGDAAGISSEQDVIIHRNDVPVFQPSGVPICPAESVLAALEVKTCLDKSGFDDVRTKADSIGTLASSNQMVVQLGEHGAEWRDRKPRILTGVICFATSPDTRAEFISTLNEQRLDCPNAPDFILNLKWGLIVRCDHGGVPNIDVLRGVAPRSGDSTGKAPTGYQRFYRHNEAWKGLFTLVLELTERLQRYALVYSDLGEYASGRTIGNSRESGE